MQSSENIHHLIYKIPRNSDVTSVSPLAYVDLRRPLASI